MASVAEVQIGIDAGKELVTQAQARNEQVITGANELNLEQIVDDFEGMAARLAHMAETVGRWPVDASQQRRGEAERQFTHSLEGADHPEALLTFADLGRMGMSLNEAQGRQLSLSELLRAVGGAATALARRIADEAVPAREIVKDRASEATVLGDAVKDHVDAFSSTW